MSPAPQRTVLKAASLPAPLTDLRRTDASGMVLAVFERSVYLDLDGRILALGTSDLARGPLLITLRHAGSLPSVAVAEPAHVRDGTLHAGPIAADLRHADIWDPTLPRGETTGLIGGDARAVVIGELLASAPDEGIASLLASSGRRDEPGTGRVTPHTALLISLARGLAAIDLWFSGRADAVAAASAVAEEIAGRGPGLTPSGDDLLMGILNAVTTWPAIAGSRDRDEVRNVLARAALPRTTRISGAYLEAARQGWAVEPWHDLILALAGPPDRLCAAVRRLIGVGETSGADALTGFCWAWRRAPA